MIRVAKNPSRLANCLRMGVASLALFGALIGMASSEERRRTFLDGSSRITIRQGEYVFINPGSSEGVNLPGCSSGNGRTLVSTSYRQSSGLPEKFVFDQPDTPQTEILTATQAGSDLVVRFISQGKFLEYVAPTTLVTKTDVYSDSGRRCENIATPYKYFEYAKMKKTGTFFWGRISPDLEVLVAGVGFSRTYKLAPDLDNSQIRIPLETTFFSKLTTGFFQLNVLCVNCSGPSKTSSIPVVIELSKLRAAQVEAEERARAEARQRAQEIAAEEKLREEERERARLEEERARRKRADAERQAQQRALEIERQAEAKRQEELKRQKKRELLRNL